MARTCNHNNDCPQGKKCQNGWCAEPASAGGQPVYTCNQNDQHCPPGTTCQNGTCVAASTPPPTQCAPGTHLENGTCVPDQQAPPPPPPPSGGGGGGQQQAPANMPANCDWVCGDTAIAVAKQKAADAQDAMTQAKGVRDAYGNLLSTQQNEWQGRLSTLIPHNTAPVAPGAPGGYQPGTYNNQPGISQNPVTTMPPAPTPTPTPTPAPTPTPSPTPRPGGTGGFGGFSGGLAGAFGGMTGSGLPTGGLDATNWNDVLRSLQNMRGGQ